VDALRISDVRRYEGDFVPPTSQAELEVDDHTRLLLRLDGNLEGEGHGREASLPEGAVTLRGD
jgi:hypothetical protein